MKLWVTVRGDEELYVSFPSDDPGDWRLAYPSPEETTLCNSLTQAESDDVERQIFEAMSDPTFGAEDPE